MCSPPDAGDGLMELLAHCAPPVDGGVGDVLDESERWAGTLHVQGALGKWLRLMKCVPSTNKIFAAVRNRLIKVGPPFVEGAGDEAPAGGAAGLRDVDVLVPVCMASARSASTHMVLPCVVLVRVGVCDIGLVGVDAHGVGS